MIYKLVITDTAKKDYRNILNYFDKIIQDRKALDNIVSEFRKIADLVVENLDLFGLSRGDSLNLKNYHKVNINKYLMLYKVDENNIYIIHIFHQLQDYAKLC